MKLSVYAALISIAFAFTSLHPLFLSVTELKYNSASKKMEISVKLFIDDFEKTLQNIHHNRIDLINPKDPAVAEQKVEEYISNNLKIQCDAADIKMHFIGYEKEDEAIWAYFESDELNKPHQINISNTLLYQYIEEQMNIMHVQIGNDSKSYKLNNPEGSARFVF